MCFRRGPDVFLHVLSEGGWLSLDTGACLPALASFTERVSVLLVSEDFIMDTLVLFPSHFLSLSFGDFLYLWVCSFHQIWRHFSHSVFKCFCLGLRALQGLQLDTLARHLGMSHARGCSGAPCFQSRLPYQWPVAVRSGDYMSCNVQAVGTPRP